MNAVLIETAKLAKVLFAALFGGLLGCSPAQVPVDLLVENVTVYLGSDAAPFVATVAIQDGRFLAINPSGQSAYISDYTIDGTGQFMTPGLWDAHAHVRSSMERDLDTEEFVRFGVTSIHDLGGNLERLKSVEREIANGTLQGPSIYSSYFMLNGESFADYQRVVTTEAEIKAAIDELVSAGAIQVKVHRALSPDMLPVVVRFAHKRGLKVTGHIPLGVHPLDACKVGMDGVEHIGSFVEALVSVAPEGERSAQVAIDHLLSEAADSIYRCLNKRNVVVTPTLVIYPAIAKHRAAGEDIPPEFVDFIESMERITYRLYESGVTLLTGTDTSDFDGPIEVKPGISLLDEMVMLEEAGIPPTEIITMASLNAARSIGVSNDTGSIQTGKRADFLLLSADPGESVRNFQSVVSVYQKGQAVFSTQR